MKTKVFIAASTIGSLFVMLIVFSCEKSNEIIGTIPIAKVNVINAVVTSGSNVRASVADKEMSWSNIGGSLGGFDISKLFIVPTDRNTIFKVAPVSDTTKLWYDKLTKLNAGKTYTLYLSGVPGAVNTLLHEETNFPSEIIDDISKPNPVTDSIVNIRFVNLSQSGPKVDVNISGNSINEASDLGYQQFSDFKAFPATYKFSSINFEIRKSSDKQLIMTYSYNVPFFLNRSVALVIKGIYNPTSPLPFTDRYGINAVPYSLARR